MRGLWLRWVRWCHRPIDPRPAALSRVLLATCVVADQLRLWQVGLVDHVYRTYADGGLSAFAGVDYALGSLGPQAGLGLWATLLVCMVLVGAGALTRPAILVGVLAYAQLGHLYPPGDRGVDRVIRTMLLLLALSWSHRRWSLLDRLRGRPGVAAMPAWPVDLVRLVAVLIYLGAGFAKLGSGGWLDLTGQPELYRIMADPLAASLDHLAWADHPWPFRIGAVGTIALELSAPLLLTRWAPWWALFGAAMHLGIAATMELGMFSFGMLSLYPIFFSPWLVRWLDRAGGRGA